MLVCARSHGLSPSGNLCSSHHRDNWIIKNTIACLQELHALSEIAGCHVAYEQDEYSKMVSRRVLFFVSDSIELVIAGLLQHYERTDVKNPKLSV